MARINDRRSAIKLRLSGATYNSIRDSLGVSKSTLAGWLKNIPLSDKQIQNIKNDARTKRIESYIKTTKERRRKIFESFCIQEKSALLPLTERELLIAGLFLYLGEGAKSDWWRIQISNTDPSIIRFSVYWLTKILGADKNKLKIQLHLYSDMDVSREIKFWQNITRLRINQFIKPYIKKTSSQKIDHPSFGHGTCNVYISKVDLKHKIMAGIKVILDSINGPVVQRSERDTYNIQKMVRLHPGPQVD